jgi:surfactin synthase thioesterase subunit
MITVNLTKARGIAHDIRRAGRDKEMEPHDKVISLQLPGKAKQDAEAARERIRQKYDAMQTKIDSATSVAELKAALAGQ